MERLPAELEGVAVLRNLGEKSKAEAILAEPSNPKWLMWLGALGVAGAALVARFALQDFNAPVAAVAVLAGMLAGLIALAIELWAVRRRLESVIQLITLRRNEQA